MASNPLANLPLSQKEKDILFRGVDAFDPDTQRGFAFAMVVELKKLEAKELVAVNMEMHNPENSSEVAFRPTQKGIDESVKMGHVRSIENEANVASSETESEIPMSDTTTTAPVTETVASAPVAATPAPAKTPRAPRASVSEFEIETNVEFPGSARRSGLSESYPFSSLPNGGSFFVEQTADRPDVVKSMGSTVTSANRRYSKPVEGMTRTNRKGREVPVLSYERFFVVRPGTKTLPDGSTVKGARIFRKDDMAPSAEDQAD